jgi:hypothetical protein
MICSIMDCSVANDPETHAAKAQAALWRQVELLEMLAETGVQFAQAIASRAIADQAALSSEALATESMAFSRAARAVRMTALLQSRLIQEMDDARRRAAFQTTDEREAAEEAERRRDPAYHHKARVEAIVGRVARAQFGDGDDLDRIAAETAERLDDDDIYGDVLTRPVGELVALICRDLGLEPDWARLGQEAWAKIEIEQDLAGSPFLSCPLPPGGGEVGREGDASLKRDAPLISHPHPQPFSHPGRREACAFPVFAAPS